MAAWAVRGVRLLAVLALLTGVLAMHGLAPGHQRAAQTLTQTAARMAMATPAAGPAQLSAHASGSVTTASAAHAPAAVPASLAVQAPCDSGCPDAGHGPSTLCLAVLTAAAAATAAAAVLALVAHRGPARVLRRPPSVLTHARPPRRPRRIDLVADLCICRT